MHEVMSGNAVHISTVNIRQNQVIQDKMYFSGLLKRACSILEGYKRGGLGWHFSEVQSRFALHCGMFLQGEPDKREDRSGAKLGILQQNSFLLMESVAMVTQCACIF